MKRLLTALSFACCLIAVTACSERTSAAAEFSPDAASSSGQTTHASSTVHTLPETRIEVDADRLAAIGASDEDSSEREADDSDDETSGATGPGLDGEINLNTATLEDLMMLPGVGPAIAGRIADYRKQRHFEQPTDLKRVRGIGDKTYEKMAPYVRVSGQTTLSD